MSMTIQNKVECVPSMSCTVGLGVFSSREYMFIAIPVEPIDL